MMDVTWVNVLALALFVVGGGLVAVMVVVTQRSYKRDERTEHWVQYPTAKGEVPVVPPQPGVWALVMDDAGPKPIHVVKEIRAFTKLGLVEAKRLADHTPSTVLARVDHAAASVAYRVLTNVGATVRITEVDPTAETATVGPIGPYAVVMDDAGPEPIYVVKEIRARTELGLAEAKRLADHTPSTIVSGVDHETASLACAVFAKAGATVRITEVDPAADAARAADGAPTAAGAGPAGTYAVVVDHAGPKLIHVIKEIRALTGLGLAEAKRLTDHTPSTVLSGVDHATATAARGRLTDAGATVRVAES